MTEFEVSVIIINYNTFKMTSKCIDTVIAFTKKNTFEIILVDNASTDGSKEYFSGDERVKYIYLDKNIGFGRANNVGIYKAKGKYIFLLNSDTLLIDDAIKQLFDFAELHNHNLGAVGSCLINLQKEDVLSFGLFLSPNRIYRRLLENIGLIRKSFEQELYDKIALHRYCEVDYISGADLFIPAVVFSAIKPFDPDFFMYYEETDLQKRMEIGGLKRYAINFRNIIHLEGGSFGYDLPFKRKMMMTKSMKMYINKHFSGIKKIHVVILSILIIFKDIIRMKYSIHEKFLLIREIAFGGGKYDNSY